MQIQQSPGLGLVRSPKTACKVGKLKGKSMFHCFTNCHWFRNSEMSPQAQNTTVLICEENNTNEQLLYLK